MERTLCPRCLSSVEKAALVPVEGVSLCPACAERAARRSARPAGPSGPARAAPPAPTLPARLVEDARLWCRGRSWWIRVPVLVYLAWVGWNYALEPLHPDPAAAYVSLFDGINLGFHEIGHIVFRPFGRFLHILGGTLLQLIMPLAATAFLLHQRDYFGVAFGVGWVATNLFGISTYMADAQTRSLPLVAPGVGRVDANAHDWWNLLGDAGLLEQAETMASIVRLFGVLTMLGALALGGWLCWTMARAAREARAPGRRAADARHE